MDEKKYGTGALDVLLNGAELGVGDGPLSYYELRTGTDAHEGNGIYVREDLGLDAQTLDDLTGDYARRRKDGPLLPVPFTMRQLVEFDRTAGGVLSEGVECLASEDTDAVIAKIRNVRGDAGELAHALIHGMPEAETPMEQSTAAEVEQSPAPRVHGIERRTDALHAVFGQARLKAANPDDWPSVWQALVELAESSARPRPLIGYVEGEGVKWRRVRDGRDDAIEVLTRGAFRQRWYRQR